MKVIGCQYSVSEEASEGKASRVEEEVLEVLLSVVFADLVTIQLASKCCGLRDSRILF